MKTILAGSRTATPQDVDAAIKSCPWVISSVVSGCAVGADTFGAIWARYHNLPLKCMPADWERYNKRAGYLRNQDMASESEALIAVWDGKSKGTAHMIDIATKLGLHVHIHKFA